MSEDIATAKHLRVGDTLPVAFKDTGQQQMRVAMIYAQDRVVGPYLLGLPAYDGNFSTHFDTRC